MVTVKDIYDYIDSLAPYSQAEEWDNSGLLVGSFSQKVEKAVVSLDATKEVCTFACEIDADIVLTHHPIIFKPLYCVNDGSAVDILVRSGISALCAHTNFDVADGGTNDNLAKILSLSNIRRCDDGITVLGDLSCEMSIDDFAAFVSDRLRVAGIRYTDSDKPIKTVALCGGAGAEYQQNAAKQCDCFVTGDMSYHNMLEASEKAHCVISAGHFETEYEAFMMFADKIAEKFNTVEFVPAPVDNPIKTV